MIKIYLTLGFEHLVDINAYDHLLFLVALVAIYQLREWKKLLWIITAFTIGHSLTLALSTLDFIRFPAAIVEALIPITILITCLYNFFKSTFNNNISTNSNNRSDYINSFFALFFGLIHGMGFSSYLKSMMMPGDDHLLLQLFAFNLGIELGQILIMAVLILLFFLILKFTKIPQNYWRKGISFIVGILAIQLLF